MAGHALIEAHLAVLARHLPPDTVDELADGLTETYRRHRDDGVDPDAAARAAIAEFGHPEVILASFTRQAPGRRAALALLGTGPLFAACWGPSLILGRAWTWPISPTATAVFALLLLAVVASLITAATSHHDYRRTRLAAAGGAGLVLLDAAALAAVALAAPVWVWPMALAVPASLARIGLTLRSLPTIVTR
ncbi:MAG TPA: hypothetical protein VFV67_08235 [Actinophytocola sp.]|uniref:hypothetical protein n=1 Tax=Actinophytocola sp. TaxID=1872138 RepID=UPI002DBBE6F1|nr:hypothetical protein [Actinophytocola sp.]HEU5470627.1 hypothetical protein [Actinophytocola sp.]